LPVVSQSELRVFLQEVGLDGTTVAHEVRQLVYSQANRNTKIEIGATRRTQYPSDGTPILVFSEIGTRVFRYVLLMPNDHGYTDVSSLLESLEKIGRGFHRGITTLSALRNAWAGCPL
jgi:hypothetical protein